jgi:16S rRNA processing protein RimM
MSSRFIERFVAGMLGQPFGLEGFVKFRSFSGETAHLERLGSMTLRKNGVETARRVVEIRPDMRPRKHAWKGGPSGDGRSDGGIILFEGVDGPEKAKLLTGSEIVVSREDAAPLEEGEYYIEDLKGLCLVADGKTPGVEAGAVFGVVTGVFEGGGGLLLEVNVGETASADGSRGGTRLVPFRDEFTGAVSLENGTIVLRAPWVLD